MRWEMAPSREITLALDGGGRSWRRRGSEGALTLSPAGLVLEHARALREPLVLGAGAVAVACVEPGGARASGSEGRFPVLRRLGPSAVVPRAEGVEGWAWTSSGGSAFTDLCEQGDAPNLALVLAQPLGEKVVERVFAPEVAAVVAGRSPLGAPAVHGLLLRVADAAKAERAFGQVGLLRPLTDREVPPTLRRSLPTDRPADPALDLADPGLAARSVAPPGLG